MKEHDVLADLRAADGHVPDYHRAEADRRLAADVAEDIRTLMRGGLQPERAEAILAGLSRKYGLVSEQIVAEAARIVREESSND